MDNLANLFSKIKNAQNRHKNVIKIHFSKKSWNICNILFLEGFIKGFGYADALIQDRSSLSKAFLGNQPQLVNEIGVAMRDHRFTSPYSFVPKDSTLQFRHSRCIQPRSIFIFLKYFHNKPIIRGISKLSLQGRRLYTKSERNNLQISYNSFPNRCNEPSSAKPHQTQKNFKVRIVSTSKGIMTERDAFFFGIGGELICEIY